MVAAVLALAWLVSGCTQDGINGYVLVVDNRMDAAVRLELGGHALYDDAGAPFDVGTGQVQVPAHSNQKRTPFVETLSGAGNSGWTATVRVFDAQCLVIGPLEVSSGEHTLNIGPDGALSLLDWSGKAEGMDELPFVETRCPLPS